MRGAGRAAVAREVFIDTSAWYPIVVRGHPDHEELSAELKSLVRAGDRLVTTNLVIAETHALLTIRAGTPTALAFLRHATAAPTEVVTSTPELELEAQVAWLTRFADQAFSLTDAVSFVVMTRRRIRSALTLDHHFAVAGFSMAAADARPAGKKVPARRRR
jgi:predicted nucleic acid-binding protein